ncbi:MAG TPA: glycoside hydrolase family 9 protein, partial [Daejeonella sp.]|nr:glycoside hydrolase family 9 protein [Daejeonella sp.]
MVLIGCLCFQAGQAQSQQNSWIRVNLMGYTPGGVKVAVLGSKEAGAKSKSFQVVDAATSKVVLNKKAGKNFGEYGPFLSSFRLDFSDISKPGTYYLKLGDVKSPEFKIAADVYSGSADFALRYMRQQRCGYNPYLKTTCHPLDGYIVYGPGDDKAYTDVTGGWHDASDYLQYSTTSANATYHLLAAYRDYPQVFGDKHLTNGLDGDNGMADVLDEAKWGLDWLLKMHPREDWMFNQIADDRDHSGYRLPNEDKVDYGYGPGTGRPVYFITGEKQGLGRFKNNATGAASTAGKFASAFALGSQVFGSKDPYMADVFKQRSLSAYKFGLAKPGVAQTASVKSPYIYAEDNWVDDMELGAAAIYQLTNDKSYLQQALKYSTEEKITPWLGADTAKHYQWYPFHNFGHYELAVKTDGDEKAKLISYYKEGIDKVWQKSKGNAFYRGVPFIWCSNNLTTSFAIQCVLYRELSGDNTYIELEQAAFDWLFGVNPWGTGMVFGLPANADTPESPHSSFTELKKYPLDGGLVDGPVYGSIFNSLIGIEMSEPDEFAQFQSKLAVYHDDIGDYSTNEPTMDGTASLVYLLAAKESQSKEV